MTERNALQYSLKWHEYGDPDVVSEAIAYGTVSMAIIWMVENLAHRILFACRDDLSLSECSALVTFKGGSWVDLILWTRSRWWLGIRAEQLPFEGRRVNSRAVMGIILRVLVIFLEIGIIILFIPFARRISENQVGSSQINFNGEGNKLVPKGSSITIYGASCFRDPVKYEGFRVQASREVCFDISPTYNDRASALAKKRLESKNLTGYTEVTISCKLYLCLIFLRMERAVLRIEHRIRIIGGKDFGFPGSSIFPLMLPRDAALQMSKAILLLRRTACLHYPGRNRTRLRVSLVCKTPKTAPVAIYLRGYLPRVLHTKKVAATPNKTSHLDRRVNDYLKVGELNRPRLCLIPALIVLIALGAVNTILHILHFQDNIYLKLFHLSKEAVGADCMSNPLFADRKTIELRFSAAKENPTFGYFHRHSELLLVDDAVPIRSVKSRRVWPFLFGKKGTSDMVSI